MAAAVSRTAKVQLIRAELVRRAEIEPTTAYCFGPGEAAWIVALTSMSRMSFRFGERNAKNRRQAEFHG